MISRQQQQPPPMQMMNQLPPPQMMSQPMPMPIMNRSYGMWPQPPLINNPAMEPIMFLNPFSGGKPSGPRRNNNWQGKKKGIDGQKDSIIRRNEKYQQQALHKVNNFGNQNQHLRNIEGGGYQPPTLLELQSQNRTKAKKYYNPNKKFNNRFAPYAPRNTSSFIIRAKKSGGIASLVSPSPVTPAVLPTPVFSPSTEVLGDIAKEEWGVDGYGSMNGLIRLRSPGSGLDLEGDEDDESSDSESDVEEHVEVERRLDHDLSRFEMIYPNCPNADYNNLLENRVEDQDTHIAHLEEENLTLKERLFLTEREMRDTRRRLQGLEKLVRSSGDVTEEVVENGSDNDAESSGRGHEEQLGVGVNEELEYVDECRKVNDHSYQVENANVVPQAVIVNQDALHSNDNIEVSGELTEANIKGDANMDESETVPGQARNEVGMSGC